MAFDRVERHPQQLGDLGRVEVFLVAQCDDGPLDVRQLGDELAQLPVAQRIAVGAVRGLDGRGVVEADGLQPGPAGDVDAAVARDREDS